MANVFYSKVAIFFQKTPTSSLLTLLLRFRWINIMSSEKKHKNAIDSFWMTENVIGGRTFGGRTIVEAIARVYRYGLVEAVRNFFRLFCPNGCSTSSSRLRLPSERQNACDLRLFFLAFFQVDFKERVHRTTEIPDVYGSFLQRMFKKCWFGRNLIHWNVQNQQKV